MNWTVFAIVGVILLLIIYVISVNNKLVILRNKVKEGFSQIDVQLKKRYDLIPNLVETVKQYMSHEEGTLTKITELRSRLTSGNVTDSEKVKLNNELTNAIRGIMVQVEAYPDLKANQNFLSLQNDLNSVENTIAQARTGYNSTVLNYNNACMVFPNNIIAGLFGFTTEEMFEITNTSERENVDVKNLFNN